MTSVESSLSLRERKRIKTQIQLAEKAFELFHERGYDNVTVDEIAAAVDLSPRTFFRYYPSKEDVLFPNESESSALLRRAILARPAEESVLVAVKNAFLDLVEDLEHRREPVLIRKAIINESPGLRSRELEQQARWEQILTDAIAERMEVSSTLLAPRVIAAACVAGMRAAIDTWLETVDEQSLAELAVEVLDRLDTGLRGFTD